MFEHHQLVVGLDNIWCEAVRAIKNHASQFKYGLDQDWSDASRRKKNTFNKTDLKHQLKNGCSF